MGAEREGEGRERVRMAVKMRKGTREVPYEGVTLSVSEIVRRGSMLHYA